MFARHDGDALRRTNRFAQHATDTAWAVILAQSQPVAAPVPRHEWPHFFRKLNRRRGGPVLQAAELVSRVQKEIAEKMCKRDFEAADDLWDVELFPERQFASADNFHNSHQRTPPKNVS